jgi:carboxypeptidase family protein
VFVALACLFSTWAPGGASAATGSIGGTVADASTHEPIELAEVCAWSADEEEGGGGCAHTEEDGTYLLGGLKTGEYKVEFWSAGYSSQYYDGKGNWWEADPVTVEAAASTAGIDAELAATAKIEGTVTATEDGLGVEEVEVCAYPLAASEENFYECGYSDSDGTYSIVGLAPGNYKVEFWPAYTGRNLAYQFFDHKSRYAEADVVSLAEGEQKTGIDADLPPGAAISGTVATGSGLSLEEVLVCSIDAGTGKLTTCTWTYGGGKYRLWLLPADDYKVVFSPEFWEFFPGEAFPGEDGDGLPTQFWNNQATLSAANILSLGAGSSAAGIDARFGAAVTPFTPPTVTPSPRRHHRCPRGKRKRRVHGKVRCVRVHKHRRRHHHRHRANAFRLAPRTVRFVAR